PRAYLDVFDADGRDTHGPSVQAARGEVGGGEFLGSDARQCFSVIAVRLVARDQESVLIIHEFGRVEERSLGREARGKHVVIVLCRTEAAALLLVESGEAAANGDTEIPGHEVISSTRVAWSNRATISCFSMPGWVGTAAS